ncbi:hypothetical protein QR680_018349 [Steinernema hermaphroditum]|uniref:Uncharacterized protein n=1 Tax=Steinernema hermaphroditum TaxID=289476 RepID=A0AA39HIH7_9BILA|nr:hypothetical protein QR680_018349 [Steinernema hermaphroditum]
MERIHEEEETETRRPSIPAYRSQLSEPAGYNMDENRVVAPVIFTGKEHFTISYASCINREPMSPGGNLRSPFLFSPSAGGDKNASMFVYPPEMAPTRKGLFPLSGPRLSSSFQFACLRLFSVMEFKERVGYKKLFLSEGRSVFSKALQRRANFKLV